MYSIIDVTLRHAVSILFPDDPAPAHIYTLSLHDALPISLRRHRARHPRHHLGGGSGTIHRAQAVHGQHPGDADRKSTRLNSSHVSISYAVFCLKKKNTHELPRKYVDNSSNVVS